VFFGDVPETVYVSETGAMEYFEPGVVPAKMMNPILSPSSITFWEQASNPALGVEHGSCSDGCPKFFYTTGTTLNERDDPFADSPSQTAKVITTSHGVGSVAWGGDYGSALYVTYPKDASVGIIKGLSATESLPAISLPGTTPYALAIPAHSNPLHYMLSGSPSTGLQLVSFTDKGPVKTASIGTNNGVGATAFGANGNYVAVVQVDLLVYDKNLNFLGKVAINGKKVGNVTLTAANEIVVDQNSNTAYVATFSGTSSKGAIVAVDLPSLSIVGSAATVGLLPLNMILSPDGGLYVANFGDTPGTISILNAGSGGVALTGSTTVGTHPGVMALHPSESRDIEFP
jgi:hypothetical protein